MAQLISRDPDTADALYAWWDGTHLEPGARLQVADDDVALVVDGEEVLSTFGPGEHVITSKSAPELAEHLGDPDASIELCFLTTRPQRTFEVEGPVGQLRDPQSGGVVQATVQTAVMLVIDDPARYVGLALAAENDDDEDEGAEAEGEADDADESDEQGLDMVEDWIAGQILLAVQGIAGQKSDAAHDAAWFAQAMAEAVNPKLAEAGVSIASVESFDFSFEPAQAGGDDARPPEAPAPKNGAPKAGGFCGNCGAPRTTVDRFCGNCGQPFA